MEKIKKTKTIYDIRDFFMRENLYKVMKSTLSMLLKGRNMDFELKTQGGSYTDTKDILVVGLLEEFYDLSYKEIYIIILSLLGHERQHVLSTNINDYQNYINEEAKKLSDKGVNINFAKNIVSSVGNIVEDGRIELILVNEYVGYKNKIQFLNMHMWKSGGIKKDTEDLNVLMSSMWSLSKLGIYTKNYEKYFLNTDIHKEVLKIKSLVETAHLKRTSKECFNVCRDIIGIIEPFIIKTYENLKDNMDKMDKFMEMLEEMINEENFGESEEMTNNSQKHSPHLTKGNNKSNKNDEEKNESSNDSSDGEEEKEGKEDEDDKSEKPSSNSGNKNEDKDKEASKDDNKCDENSNFKGEKKSPNKNNEEKQPSKSKEEHSNKGDKDSEGKGGNDKLNNQQTSSSDIESNSKELSEGIDTESTGDNQISEEQIDKRMKKLFKELEEESNEAFSRPTPKKKKAKEDNFSLTDKEKREVVGKGCFDEVPNDFTLKYELPMEIKVPGKKFRKEIEKIFRNKSTIQVTGQKRGILNTEELYKVGMGDYNIFSVEGSKSNSNYAISILQDGSGSMTGEKEINSAYALSIIEEGLKGIVPFKLTTFKASRGEVKHLIVKDWKDKSKKNYSYNYLKNKSAGGGNEDGVSIRIATKELLKRPEKDKILIVLSDGLPRSIKDTKEAIQEARKSGIYLVGIMFGDDCFRMDNYDTYKAMYKTNIISTSPQGIPKKLTNTLKKILVR